MLILNRLDDYTPPMSGPSNEERSYTFDHGFV
jgi:hypothetical protein